MPVDEEPGPQRWPEQLQLGLSVHGGGGWGPVLAAGAVGGRFALIGPRWRAELGGRYVLPRRAPTDELGSATATASASFDTWFIEARGCFAPRQRRLEFPLCPGVELGSARGRGLAPTIEPTRASFLWVAPSLSQGLSWAPVERFAIGVELGLVVPLTRGRVGEQLLAELNPVGGRGLLIIEIRQP